MLDNYGFIKRLENLPEIFFHYSAVNPEVTELEIDDDVEFSISSRKGDKGEEKAPCATDITLSSERLIFEEISTHLFYGIVMQVPKNQNGQKFEQNPARDAGHLGGVIQCGKDLGYYEYFDKEREGNLYTLRVGDPVKFKICTDVRTDKPRAVKVSVDVEFFKTKQNSFSGPRSLPTYLLKQVKPDILKFFEEAFANEKRETGVIAAVKDGYGFIKCISRDTRLFFHCNEIIDSDHRIRMSDEIEFTVMEDSMHTRICSGDDVKQLEKLTEKIDRNGEKTQYKTQYQATRIRVLEKGSVQFHTIQDEVYEGQLICEAKDGRNETCMTIKYFRDSVHSSPDSKNSDSPNAGSVHNSEISDKLDQNKTGDTPVKERQIKVTGLNSFSPEVRVVLEKVDTNLELEDLHELPVFFQIQKSKKTGNRTAVNVLPKEWMKSISVLDDRSETSSIYDAISNSPMKGMKAPANTPHSMLNTPPRKLGLKNASPLKNGQTLAQNGQNRQIYQNTPKVSNSQSAHQITSPYNKQTSSAVKQASTTPKLSRSISSPLDKCMQKLSMSSSPGQIHTPVKTVKSNPNLLGHSKTHYGYIVTMKDHYGFIESENHEHEVFFHYSEIVSETSLNLEPKSTPNRHRDNRDRNSDSDKNDNLSKVQTAGFNFGAEVQYIYADKDGKLCAQQVQLLQKGVLTKHEYIDDQLYTGKISRPCKSVDPSQSHYFGEIQVTGFAKENEKRQYEEATPKYNLNFAEKDSKEASPNSGKGGKLELLFEKLERRQSIQVDKFPFTIVFSTISLADPQAMIIQGDPVVFKVSTHRLTNQHRAVNITPVRTKQVARIESTKGEYGFISFKVDEKDHQASLSKNGAANLPQNTGNLFFHSSELVGCVMFELAVGDVVEFNVVHNKRTNKYCAAKVRFIETKPEIMGNNDVGIDENTVEATELTSLPGVRQMLRAESNRAPFMRKISQSEVGFNAENVNEVNNSNPKNAPNSPNPRASISSTGNDANNNSNKMQTPSAPTEDTRPERIARFKKGGTNVGESLLRGENQTTRQPTTGKTEIKVGSSTSERKR
jgi:cold shock CspA family protein